MTAGPLSVRKWLHNTQHKQLEFLAILSSNFRLVEHDCCGGYRWYGYLTNVLLRVQRVFLKSCLSCTPYTGLFLVLEPGYNITGLFLVLEPGYNISTVIMFVRSCSYSSTVCNYLLYLVAGHVHVLYCGP